MAEILLCWTPSWTPVSQINQSSRLLNDATWPKCGRRFFDTDLQTNIKARGRKVSMREPEERTVLPALPDQKTPEPPLSAVEPTPSPTRGKSGRFLKRTRS